MKYTVTKVTRDQAPETTLEVIHVADCVKKAKQNRRIKHPLLIHTDRGGQYVSKIFLEETKDMTNSYSRKAYS